MSNVKKVTANRKGGSGKYLILKDTSVEVDGYIDEINVFIDNHGYIHDGIIWIYSAEGKILYDPKGYPYFWINSFGEREFSNPREEIRKKFSASNINDLSFDEIKSNTRGDEEFFDEQLIDINNSAGKYCPVIRERDDFLKKLIKLAIIEKGIDINRLKCQVDRKYTLPNMRSALNGITKTSTQYFNNWAELLSFDFLILVFDNKKDNVDPLKEPIVYSSLSNDVSRINEKLDEILSIINDGEFEK